MKEVRIGIIGAGMISHRHMTVYSHIPNAKVVAVSDIDEKKLQAWSERYGVKDTYRDYRDLLKRDDIDAVDVCVHNNLHTPISIDVMKAGKECYCEKPMAGSYADAKLMYDVSKQLNRKLAVQLSSIFNAQTRIAKKMIEGGDLGKVYHVRTCNSARRRRPGVDLPNFSKDFFSSEIGGHGPLFDLGVYHISQMLFVLGLPELDSVYGAAYAEIGADERLLGGRRFEVEEMAVGMAKYKGGLSMEITQAWAINVDSVGHSYIAGSKGGLKVSGVDVAGGPLARPAGMGMMLPPEMRPALTFYGEIDGREVDIDLKPENNGRSEVMLNPRIRLYDDNQVHWIAYLTGDLDDQTRYDTPLIALNTALVSEGIFLSQQLGRSVTAEEIKEMSKSTAVRRQETSWGVIEYDF